MSSTDGWSLLLAAVVSVFPWLGEVRSGLAEHGRHGNYSVSEQLALAYKHLQDLPVYPPSLVHLVDDRNIWCLCGPGTN